MVSLFIGIRLERLANVLKNMGMNEDPSFGEPSSNRSRDKVLGLGMVDIVGSYCNSLLVLSPSFLSNPYLMAFRVLQYYVYKEDNSYFAGKAKFSQRGEGGKVILDA